MKKVFLLTMILLVGLASVSYAQDSRAERRAARKARELANQEQIAALVNSQDYMFVANNISSSNYVALTGVRLSGLYGIWVTPQQFKVYLPLYGINNFNPMSIARRIDFFTSQYSYKVQKQRNGGWYITIKATDPWSNNTYNFNLSINANASATLTVSTTFRAPISFDGTIQSLSF